MIHDRLKLLINREIDGENSPEESRELEDALRSDPGARRYRDDLLELGSRFARAGLIDPPPALRRGILAATTRRPAVARRRRQLMPDAIREAFTPRLAYAFAAGVAVCALVFALLNGPGSGAGRVPPDAARGTMAPRDASGLESAECMQFDVPGGSGTGCVSYSSDGIRVAISLDSGSETRLVLSHEGDVRFGEYRATGAGELGIADDHVTIERAAAGEYEVLFEGSSPHSPIGVEVYADGELRFSKLVEPRH